MVHNFNEACTKPMHQPLVDFQIPTLKPQKLQIEFLAALAYRDARPV